MVNTQSLNRTSEKTQKQRSQNTAYYQHINPNLKYNPMPQQFNTPQAHSLDSGFLSFSLDDLFSRCECSECRDESQDFNLESLFSDPAIGEAIKNFNESVNDMFGANEPENNQQLKVSEIIENYFNPKPVPHSASTQDTPKEETVVDKNARNLFVAPVHRESGQKNIFWFIAEDGIIQIINLDKDSVFEKEMNQTFEGVELNHDALLNHGTDRECLVSIRLITENGLMVDVTHVMLMSNSPEEYDNVQRNFVHQKF